MYLTRDEDPVVAKKPDPGLCTSSEGRFLKVYKTTRLDHLKSLHSCFHTFGFRHTIDVLDSEKPARIRGYRAYRGRLTPTV